MECLVYIETASENKTYANDSMLLHVSLDTWACEEPILLFIISNQVEVCFAAEGSIVADHAIH